VNPLKVTATPDDYAGFIASARADIGVAKHAYVASRSGWFSDRSTCFLASGRPVLHQDTGYTDWLAAAAGVIPFSDLESLIDALDRLDRDYDLHARAARRVAEEHFEARVVIAEMLQAAGLR
jgi:glycosyltransferase involved in cell wall biosynthesis